MKVSGYVYRMNYELCLKTYITYNLVSKDVDH